MNDRFADTSFLVALLNQNDESHRLALHYASEPGMRMLTTRWVLVELANWFAASRARTKVLSFVESLARQPLVTILPATEAQFAEGLALYHQRADKAWSLTDCISFAVMQDARLTEALTADHHFEQAGFRALLRPLSQ